MTYKKIAISILVLSLGFALILNPNVSLAKENTKSSFKEFKQERIVKPIKRLGNRFNNLKKEFNQNANLPFKNKFVNKVARALNDPTIEINSTSPISDEPSVNLANGAATINYPLDLPSGRLGQSPNLQLSYSSQNAEDSIAGFGWELETAYVKRSLKYGTEDLYNNNEFILYLGGASYDLKPINLVDGSHGEYGVEFEDGAIKYLEWNLDDSWTLISADGVVFNFGTDTNSRQDNAGDLTQIFKWQLDYTEDTNGNNITYEYYKDSGQIYPKQIDYSDIYTVRIEPFATGTPTERSDAFTSYESRFRVETLYRIDSIEMDVDDRESPAKKHEINYTTGDNGIRSLIGSIVVTAKDIDGNETILPETSFTYQTKQKSWTNALNDWDWGIPNNFGINYDWVVPADINGDSLIDILYLRDNNQNNALYLNTGSGWEQDYTWTLPTDIAFDHSGTILLDVNADGLPDILRLYGENQNDIRRLFLNNGSGWDEVFDWDLPAANLDNAGFRVGDVNGDTLPDFLYANNPGVGQHTFRTFVHTGNGWEEDADYTYPDPSIAFNSATYPASRPADVNNDGLVDIIRAYYNGMGGYDKHVYLNNGEKTWVEDASWEWPDWGLNVSGSDIVDINGDGLKDVYSSRGDNNLHDLYIQSSQEWEDDTNNWTFEDIYLDSGGTIAADINGDGLNDLLRLYHYYAGQILKLYIADPEQPDILSSVTTSAGATFNYEYTRTALGGNNESLPLNVLVVDEEAIDDGLGNSYTTSYDYYNGHYLSSGVYDSDFVGFYEINATDNDGHVTKTFFHQGGGEDGSLLGEYDDSESKAGKPFRTEIWENGTDKIYETIIKWNQEDLGDDRYFVYKEQEVEKIFDNNNSKDKAKSYNYDDYGNVIQEINWGEVEANDDGSFSDVEDLYLEVQRSFNYNQNDHVYSKVNQETILDDGWNVVSDNKYYYDDLAHGQVDIGNLTEESKWLDTNNSWIDSEFEYNDYGLLINRIDERGNVTNISYDDNNLYPETVTNALGHEINYEYDIALGKVISETDANGRVLETDYDGFGRILETRGPEDDDANTLVTLSEVSYEDDIIPQRKTVNNYINDSLYTIAEQYTDGLGRTVQARSSLEDNNNFSVVDTSYDQGKQVIRQSLAYESTGADYTSPDLSWPAKENVYDVLNRITSETTPVGTTSFSYNLWTQTITDALGNEKDLTNDAFNRLSEVTEHNDGQEYITSYEYSLLNKLINITDDDNNQRNFEYDSLARLVESEDLHDAADNDYGIWQYEYDAAGNLVQKIDPRNNVAVYTYDELNRPLVEQVGDVEIARTYDTADNGIGQLAWVDRDGNRKDYVYTINGRVNTKYNLVGFIYALIQYTYNRNGFIESKINPDNSTISWEYNQAGKVESIFLEDDNGTQTLVDDIDYNANGQAENTEFINNIATTNNYEAEQLYRLENRNTVTNNGTVQDFNYTYDAVGNVDTFSSLIKSVDYDYDDLNRLTVAETTANNVTTTQTWEYNALGNILNSSDLGDYDYDEIDYANPHAVTNIGTDNYEYDEAGNLISKDSINYEWNVRNELATTDDTNFVYDESGNRIIKTYNNGNDEVVNYYLADDYEVEITNNDPLSTIIYKRISAGDKDNIVTIKTKPALQERTIAFQAKDHLGGAAVIVDENGDLLEQLDYHPYGSTRLEQVYSDFEESRKFTGKELDEETGLYYFGARYYDSDIGRFTSQDPAAYNLNDLEKNIFDPQNLNTYSYSRNNPIVFIDPDGRLISFFKGMSPLSYTGIVTALDQARNNMSFLPGYGPSDVSINASLAKKVQSSRARRGVAPHGNPVNNYYRQTFGYGEYDSELAKYYTSFEGQKHPGVDLGRNKAESSSPVIHSTINGSASVNYGNGYGLHVRIYNNNFQAIYGHLDSVSIGEIGSTANVRAGQDIGVMGNTGNGDGGIHLHYELRNNGWLVNPNDYGVSDITNNKNYCSVDDEY